MAVLTHKEFSDLNQEEKKIETSGSEIESLPKVIIKKPESIYYFFHPDNPKENPINGIYLVSFEGKEHKLKIVNGVVSTTEEEIKNILINKGFILMYKKENQNGH